MDGHVTYLPARRVIRGELSDELVAVESACGSDRGLLLCLRPDLALREAEEVAASDAL